MASLLGIELKIFIILRRLRAVQCNLTSAHINDLSAGNVFALERLYRTAFSTASQSIQHQLEQAKQAGFIVDDVVEDAGVSAVQIPLQERDNGKRLFDLLRDGDVLVVRWVDRLGRNYDDIQKNIRLFLDRVVTIKTVINSIIFDTKPKDAMAKAIFYVSNCRGSNISNIGSTGRKYCSCKG